MLGFASKNDRPMIRALSFIGFLDSNNKPNEAYANFKLKAKSRQTMASALKSSYSELFQLYPDAYNRDTDSLEDFFKSKTSAGQAVVSMQVTTFKSLCEFADFVAAPESEEKEDGQEETQKQKPKAIAPQISINLQIVLPESTDPKTYEAIFKALSEHLLKGST